ncbi:hypothetical protein KCMC57_up11560 [Kitasatospora sp. CMC57]|uniref:Uncharacterized protein n=1 Tax=Kitasatospora sp. CMC57 TaxID=3231513 RepID=A0AB33JNF6_9ACTN
MAGLSSVVPGSVEIRVMSTPKVQRGLGWASRPDLPVGGGTGGLFDSRGTHSSGAGWYALLQNPGVGEAAAMVLDGVSTVVLLCGGAVVRPGAAGKTVAAPGRLGG